VKLNRDARTLQGKSISSMRYAMTTFNSFDDDGRVCSVLLHLQHSFEMLLKAVLCQNRLKVFDKTTGRSFGFLKCVRICSEDFGLTTEEAGIMRSIDALRNDAQHWYVYVSEDILYMQMRAAITAFDGYMQKSLDVDLFSQIPSRVLPVSTHPPGDIQFLFDREYSLIRDLLKPGKRQRDEARGRIRSLLAMESIVKEDTEVSEPDVNRVEKAIKSGAQLSRVFPRLTSINTRETGEGITLKVHFSKKEGAPVRYIGEDDPEEAAAIREVDLLKRFHMGASELAKALNMTAPKSFALRRFLDIDGDKDCMHEFSYGRQRYKGFSDKAERKMRAAIADGVEMRDVWREYKSRS